MGVTFPGKGFYGGEFDGMGQMWVARKSGSSIYIYHVNPSTWSVTFIGSQATSYGLNGLTTFPAAW